MTTAVKENTVKKYSKKSYGERVKHDLKTNKALYISIIPVLIFYIVFCYIPMYGILMAFQDYNPARGIAGSTWVGFHNFKEFFSGIYFKRSMLNTITISFSSIFWGFPAPIILAVLMNEVKNKYFKKTIQTVTYLPHFISLLVICGMIHMFTGEKGIVNDIIAFFGGERATLLNNAKNFVPVYVISEIWQGVGWGSIIYLAALSGISNDLYEAAHIDGAGRLRQVWHVTLPGLIPTIMTMLILRLGSILNVGFEKIILLYNPINYSSSDVISSYVYRVGLQEFRYGFSAAVGLFNSVIGCTIVLIANNISKRVNDTSLW